MTTEAIELVTETVRDNESNQELISLGQWWWVSRLSHRVKVDDFNEVDPRQLASDQQIALVVDDEDDEDEEEEEEEDEEEEDDDDDEEVEPDEDDSETAGDDEPEPPPTRWLACVTEVGTNYAKLTGPDGRHQRIHFDAWDKWCLREHDAPAFVKRKVESHTRSVGLLLEEVRRVTAELGVVPRRSIDGSAAKEETALATAHGVADIKAHQLALVDAKKNVLPGLFKRVEEHHELMAKWMRADLVSATAQLDQMKKDVSVIDDRIHTVELYAGLVEHLKQVRKGKPADDETKVHIFQRRHYMDEECLANYEAGGMEFKQIGDFDKWISRSVNFNRILPFDRAIVAFRVRRNMKRRESIDSFVRMDLENADKMTFLYIRNGTQLWRMTTEIDFGSQLFPDIDSHELIASQEPLYADVSWSRIDIDKIIPESRYLGLKEEHEKWERERDAYEKYWKRLSKKERDGLGFTAEPWRKFSSSGFSSHRWERVDKESVYYDDVMREIARVTIEHNRVATVLQGLLDRSECLLPHPPWKIWKPDGFAAGIKLVYDDALTLTPGDAPDFHTYRHLLNQSIRVGSLVIGQEDVFLRREAIRENAREQARYNRRGGRYSEYEHTWHRPYGNPGPKFIAAVEAIKGDACVFTWERSRERRKWVDNPDKPGWMKKDDSPIGDKITVSRSALFNVSAYTPGDFHKFYDDPRTRAQYLRWAPFLLSAEDYYADPKKYANESIHHDRLGGTDTASVTEEEED